MDRNKLKERHEKLKAELESIEHKLSQGPEPKKEVEVITIQARKEKYDVVDVWFSYPDKEGSGEYMVIGKFKEVSDIWQPIQQFVDDNFDHQTEKQIIVNLLDNTNGS